MEQERCPSRDALATWIRGDTTGAEAHPISAHVSTCKACSDYVEACTGKTSGPKPQERRPALPSGYSDLTTLLPTGHQDSASPFSNMLGPYRRVRLLGSGGMGEVWLAQDTRLERLVAIKSPTFIGRALLDRFAQEAKLIGKLRHPHICAVYDIFEVDHRPYMVLEYVDGVTLSEWMAGGQTWRAVAELVRKIASAVEFAHSQGIIHRDLKPANVLVTEDDDPRILDFGLAKVLDGEGPDLTQTEQLLGTPAYMAPEQARRDHAAVGNTADVYALGAILYRLLAGRSPFQGENVLQRVQTESPPAPRSLNGSAPRDLETICLHAMAREPSERYPSALAMAFDLESWLAGRPIQARRWKPFSRAYRWTRQHAALVTVSLTVSLLLLALTTWLMGEMRTAAIRNRIDQAIAGSDTLWEQRTTLESDLAQLMEYSVPAADALRSRAWESIRQDVREQLRAPRLATEQSLRVEQQLVWLEARVPGSTDAMRQLFERRRSRWQPLLDLQAPLVTSTPGIAELGSSARVTRAGIIAADKDWVSLAYLNSDPGNLEIQATFAEPPKRPVTYELQLTRPDQSALRFEARQYEDRWKLSLYQGEDRLRSAELPGPAHKAADEIRIRATIEDGSYTFEVDQQDPVRFYPLVPIRGGAVSVSAKWPQATALSSLQLYRADPPQTPSALQSGDALFAKQQWAAAREQYSQFLAHNTDAAAHSEALYRRGMCSLSLKDWGPAAEDLEIVGLSQNDRFRAAALCHCWYACRKQREFERAAGIYDHLASFVSPEVVMETLSEAQLQEIFAGVSPQLNGIAALFPAPQQVQDLERLVAMQRLLDPEFRTVAFENRFVLLRAYHSLDRLFEATELGREICDSANPMPHAIVETAWVLRVQGRAQEALELVDRHLDLSGLETSSSIAIAELRLERARVLYALGLAVEAEQEIDAFDKHADAASRYRMFAAARLMKGVLRLHANDMTGAQQAWNAGRWNRERWEGLTGTEMIYAIALEGIAADGNETTLAEIMAVGITDNHQENAAFGNVLGNNAAFLIRAVRPATQSARGREALVDIAFQRRAFVPWSCSLPTLIGHEVMLQNCPEKYQEDDFPVVEMLVKEGIEDVRGKNAAALAWLAGAMAASWKGIAPNIALSMLGERSRPALAYLLAIRYETRNWQNAAQLWQIVDDSATADSVIRQRFEARRDPQP